MIWSSFPGFTSDLTHLQAEGGPGILGERLPRIPCRVLVLSGSSVLSTHAVTAPPTAGLGAASTRLLSCLPKYPYSLPSARRPRARGVPLRLNKKAIQSKSAADANDRASRRHWVPACARTTPVTSPAMPTSPLGPPPAREHDGPEQIDRRTHRPRKREAAFAQP